MTLDPYRYEGPSADIEAAEEAAKNGDFWEAWAKYLDDTHPDADGGDYLDPPMP